MAGARRVRPAVPTPTQPADRSQRSDPQGSEAPAPGSGPRWFEEAPFREGELRLPGEESLGPEGRAAHERIAKKTLSGDVELPAFPRAVVQLVDLLQNPATDAARIERALKLDPIVAAEALRFANSALYAPTERIVDLRHAISFLGFRRLHVLALGIAAKVASGKAIQPALSHALWRHAVATGFLSMFLAREIRLDADTTFLAGLLHDVGKVAIGCELARMERKEGLRLSHAERLALCEIHHGAAGRALAAHWPLPDAVRSAIVHHHDAAAPPRDRTLVACVALADQLTHALGCGPASAPYDVFALAPLADLRWDRAAAEAAYAVAVPAMVAELAGLEPT